MKNKELVQSILRTDRTKSDKKQSVFGPQKQWEIHSPIERCFSADIPEISGKAL
jgi:hypothetical protein